MSSSLNSPFPPLLNGVEISVSWRSQTLHILRRSIDPKYSQLAEGLASIRRGRAERAGKIAAQLDKFGIHGSLEGAYAYAGNKGLIEWLALTHP